MHALLTALTNAVAFGTPYRIRGMGGPGTLWREVSIAGVYVPSLMLVFASCVAVTWLLDLLIARLGAYRFIWHPPLFRVSLFTCLLTLVSVVLYG